MALLSMLSRLKLPLRFKVLVLAAVLCTAYFSLGGVRPAQAFFFCTETCCQGACCCGNNATSPKPPDVIIQERFQELRDDFILDDFYFNTVEDDFKDWADELSDTWMMQARMIGGFYDAQAHSAAMLDIQKLTAKAMHEYQPSESVCQFGTLVKALPATDLRAKTNQLALSEIALSRHLGTFGNMAAAGRGQDNNNRILNYITTFCNFTENSEALTTFCATPAPNSSRLNHDIDYTRTFDTAETINADFTNAGVTTAENDVISLAHNLYGHSQIIQRLDDDTLDSAGGQTLLPLVRSIAAKRSLAENSFNAIAGMKAAGSGSSRTYIRQVLTNLGMPAGDQDRFMASAGATPGPAVTANPSYSAQMDILTKKIYQDPAFYVNLMDTPANVERQSASMEGLELMQDRDIFSSMSRSEMLLSVLVEMEAIKLQNNIQNQMTAK